MNNRIFNYVEGLFEEIPNTKKARDLKSEITSNLDERYSDYLREGKSANESFHLTISSLGNIDQLLQEVQPNESFVSERNKYQKRHALLTGISVAIYIMSGAVIVAGGILSERLHLDYIAELSVIATIIFCAIATAIIIYSNMSMPKEFKDKSKCEQEKETTESLYSSIYWSIITIIFFLLLFVFRINGAWLIWVFAGIIWSIIKTMFQLRNLK